MIDRVLVIAESESSSCSVQAILTSAGFDVTSTLFCSTASHQIASNRPDLVVIDTETQGRWALEICDQLRTGGYSGPVIFSSSSADVALKLDAFDIGADDVVTKPLDPLEFVARIKSGIRRSRVPSNDDHGAILAVEDAELHLGRFTYSSSTIPPIGLTPTEMRILECLMREPGRSIPRTTLIERVWDYEFVGDTNRIDVYIRRIRRKIEDDPGDPKYLHTVRGLGYMFQFREGSLRVEQHVRESSCPTA